MHSDSPLPASTAKISKARLLIVFACLVAAAFSLRDAARAWQRQEALTALARGEQPRPAIAWLGDDPQLAVMTANAALQSAQNAGTPGFQLTIAQAARAARATLAIDPLDPGALFVLAKAQAQGRPGMELPTLRLIEGLSRREIGVEMVLEREAAAQGDAEGAIRHLDRLLSISPELAPQLLPALAPTLTDDRLRRLFSDYAARSWYPELILAAIKSHQPAQVGAELINAATGKQAASVLDELRTVLFNAAADANDVEGLNALVHGLGVQDQRAIADFGMTAATAAPSLRVLRWSLTSDEIANARLESDQSLAITIASDRTASVARRVTLLPPGRYVLSHQVGYEADSTRAFLSWTMTCADPAAGAVRLLVSVPPGAPRWRGSIDIGPRCRMQRWALDATGDAAQAGSAVRVTNLHLDRAP